MGPDQEGARPPRSPPSALRLPRARPRRARPLARPAAARPPSLPPASRALPPRAARPRARRRRARPGRRPARPRPPGGPARRRHGRKPRASKAARPPASRPPGRAPATRGARKVRRTAAARTHRPRARPAARPPPAYRHTERKTARVSRTPARPHARAPAIQQCLVLHDIPLPDLPENERNESSLASETNARANDRREPHGSRTHRTRARPPARQKVREPDRPRARTGRAQARQRARKPANRKEAKRKKRTESPRARQAARPPTPEQRKQDEQTGRDERKKRRRKSTLLDMLTQRKSVGELSGQIIVNGTPVSGSNKSKYIKKMAYVPQDNLVPVLTASEAIQFAACMRLPTGTSRASRNARAADVLEVVGLRHCSDTMIGGDLPGGLSLRGLSGGEKKRLSIATCIVGAPSILFLDEPTSGLDSAAALSVMAYLRLMATSGGHAIIASIHQPRPAIWKMFDTTTVMCKGALMYFGPAEAMVNWFCDGPMKVQPRFDPAVHGVASDWVLDLLSSYDARMSEIQGKVAGPISRKVTPYICDVLEQGGSQGEVSVPVRRKVAPYNCDVPGQSEIEGKVAGRIIRKATPYNKVTPYDDDFQEQNDYEEQQNDYERHATLYNKVTPYNDELQQQNDYEELFEQVELAHQQATELKSDPSSTNSRLARFKYCVMKWMKRSGALLWREYLTITRNPADVAGG
eukprot:gene32125-16645_t